MAHRGIREGLDLYFEELSRFFLILVFLDSRELGRHNRGWYLGAHRASGAYGPEALRPPAGTSRAQAPRDLAWASVTRHSRPSAARITGAFFVKPPRVCIAHCPPSRRSPQPGQWERPGGRRRRHELPPGTGGNRQWLGSDQGGPGWVPGAPFCLPEHYWPRQRPELGGRERAGTVRGRPSSGPEELAVCQVSPSPSTRDWRRGGARAPMRGAGVSDRIRRPGIEKSQPAGIIAHVQATNFQGYQTSKKRTLLAVCIYLYNGIQTYK